MEFKRLHKKEEIYEYINSIDDSAYVALDTETTGLSWHEDRLVDVVLCSSGLNSAVVFSAEHVALINYLKSTQTLLLHNFKFDCHFLLKHGIDLIGKHTVIDTMLLHHLIDENAEHSLDSIVKELFKDNYKEVFWSKYQTYEEALDEDKIIYTCKDTWFTLQVFYWCIAELAKQQIPESLLKHVHEFAFEMFYTEHRGVKIDLAYLTEIGVEIKNRLNELEPEMRSCVELEAQTIELALWEKELEKRKTDKGKSKVQCPQFSFGSSKQLASLLYGELKLPRQYNHKTKQLTTDEKALKDLKGAHPIVDKLRENRKLQKMYSAFIEGIINTQINGRVYPGYHINGTVTGRISCSKPNLQQMPAKGQWTKIRGVFIPDEGHKIISADYAMLEIVIAAHYSQDSNLLKVVNDGASQHDITAEALGIDRDKAKTLNFAVQYGAGTKKIAGILGCTDKDAEYALNKYWETYLGLKQLIDDCKEKVDRGMPIVSIFGRIRHFEKKKRQPWDKAYRQAFNSLIQGTGADLTSQAFTLVSKILTKNKWGVSMFTVHDELVVQGKNGHLTDVYTTLDNVMRNVGVMSNLSVKLTPDVSVGLDRWSK